MSDRSVSVKLKADVSGYVASISKASLATKDFAKSAEKSATQHKQSWDKVGKGMMITGGILAAGAGLAVKAFMEFDKEMSNVKAVSNASGADMDRLSKAAIKAGADTVFSASAAAKAEAELAKAGVKTSDILGGALTGSLNLASAGGIDLADAATIAAQSMNIFKLGGKDVSHIADTLAAGANKSAADVAGLGDALKQGGLVAAQTGLHLEDTVGVLSMFADNALIGSDAGTSLKTMLMRLVPQSDAAQAAMDSIGFSAYDASGKFVGMESVAGQLKDGLGTLNEQQQAQTLTTIFGSDATRAAGILYKEGAAGVRDYTSAVNDHGAAARMAATQLDNLAGDFTTLKGSIDTALIQSGSAGNGVLRSMAQRATGVVNAFGALPAPIQQGVVKVAALGAGVLLMGGAFVTVVPKIIAGKKAIEDMEIMAGRSGIALKRLGVAMTVVAVAGPAMSAANAGLDNLFNTTIPGAKEAARALTEFATTGKASGDSADLINVQFDELGNTLHNVFSSDLGHKVNAFGQAIDPNHWFGESQTSTSKAIDFFKTLDSGLAQMVANGNADKAADLMGRVYQEASNQGIAFTKVQDALPGYMAAVDGLGVANKSAIDPVTGLSGAQTKLAGQTKAAKKAIDSEVQSLQDAGLAVLSTRSATRNLIDATNASTAAAKKNHAGLSLNTVKGRENAATLDAQASAALGLADSIFKETGSEAKMRASLVTSRAALVTSGIRFGLTKKQAEAYADSVVKIPPAKKTAVSTPGMKQAHADFKALQEEANNLPKSKSITVGVNANFSMGKGGANSFGFFTNDKTKRASGGRINGVGGPTQDNIPVWGSVGEFMVNAKSYAKHSALVNAINADSLATGGPVGLKNGGPVSLLPPPLGVRMDEASRAFLSTVHMKIPSSAGGGGAAQWSPLVLQALAMLGQSASWLPAVLARINQESGGNPRAINLTDSNATAGHPSQGLMQTIPGTFAAYAGPFAGRGITDPFASIYAGLNYALHRYGSLAVMTRPGGYDTGGMLAPGGVGKNYGKRPERVLSADQTQSFERLVVSMEGARSAPSRPQSIKVYLGTRELTDLVRVEVDGHTQSMVDGLVYGGAA